MQFKAGIRCVPNQWKQSSSVLRVAAICPVVFHLWQYPKLELVHIAAKQVLLTQSSARTVASASGLVPALMVLLASADSSPAGMYQCSLCGLICSRPWL